MSEYWDYLCFYDKYMDKSVGLVVFIRDLYRVLITKRDQWPKELEEVSESIQSMILSFID
jgi:hypothetical protein